MASINWGGVYYYQTSRVFTVIYACFLNSLFFPIKAIVKHTSSSTEVCLRNLITHGNQTGSFLLHKVPSYPLRLDFIYNQLGYLERIELSESWPRQYL